MMSAFLYSLLCLGLCKTFVEGQLVTQKQQRPHVIFIVADDFGWNDVSWHNRNINTPNLEELANGGIILNSSYTHATCSPSRAAFMTGYYPYHLGLQHSNVKAGAPTGLPLDKTFLPQKLKTLGYKNHIVGKWHLGYCNWNYTPTYRGFDSFYGYYNAGEDYYTHRAAYRYKGQKTTGLDFTFNKELIRDKNGSYSTHVFTDRAINIISNHPKESPLFLYLPFQAAHGPLQVPDRYSRPYRRKMKKPRAVFSGMVTAVDEAVGRIVDALKETQMWNNTLLIFTNDNGGAPGAMGNNYPLRGGKFTFWEGGVRGVTFIHGQMLNTSPYVYDGLFHAVDWFPTILSAVQFGSSTTAEADTDLDGIDHWQSLLTRQPSPRDEFVYNIDQVSQTGAIRVGDFKLLVGSPGDYDGWYKPGRKPPSRKKKNRKKIFATIKHPMLMLNGKKNKQSGGRNEKKSGKKKRRNKNRKNKRGKKGRRGRKNKKPASIAEFYNRGQARKPADLGVVLDSSGSIEAENFVKVKQFVKDVVSKFNIGTSTVNVGVVTYTYKAILQFNLNDHTNMADVMTAIDNIVYVSGSTNTAAGIAYMRDTMFTAAMGDRAGVPNIGIVVTDGRSINEAWTVGEAQTARDDGIIMLALGVTASVDIDEINGIASDPDSDHAFTVTDFDDLVNVIDIFGDATCEVSTSALVSTPAPTMTTCAGSEPLDVVFVLDASGSVTSGNFEKVKAFTADIVSRFDIASTQIRVGVMTYSTSNVLQFNLQDYFDKAKMINAINAIVYTGGGTYTGAALAFMRQTMFSVTNGDRVGVPDVAIVVTDGKSRDPTVTASEAQLAQDAGMTVIALGIGSGIAGNELYTIASDPESDNVFEVSDFDTLDVIADGLTASTCDGGSGAVIDVGFGDETTTILPVGITTPLVILPGLTTMATGGSTGPAIAPSSGPGLTVTVPGCAQRADIVFVLDDSGSIGSENFELIRQFISTVVAKFNIGRAGVQIGVVTYTYKARLQFHLNEHTTLADLQTAIQAIPYTTGTTDTSAGIRYMRDTMFTAANGDRSGVPNIGIVITDGRSISEAWTLREAQLARDANVTMLALGIGRVNVNEINGIASDPDADHALTISTFLDLVNVVDTIADSLCDGECCSFEYPNDACTDYDRVAFRMFWRPPGCCTCPGCIWECRRRQFRESKALRCQHRSEL
ncbi:uncharacterized protein LOC135490027 [Lineus longissimus]|uniref:uncharacterized protein LOC135490027 n=1 Tax=Lineus longissimus TaxID=88925 RepID=UPI00315D6902